MAYKASNCYQTFAAEPGENCHLVYYRGAGLALPLASENKKVGMSKDYHNIEPLSNYSGDCKSGHLLSTQSIIKQFSIFQTGIGFLC